MRAALRREAGFLTVQFVTATAASLVLVVAVVNLVVFAYARAAVRAALDEGVRAGARLSSDPAAACTERVRSVLGTLLGTPLTDAVRFDGCRTEEAMVVAHADAAFAAWLPPVPDWTFSVTAVALVEAP